MGFIAKKNIILVLFLIVGCSTFAQLNGVLSGKVIDGKSKKIIEFATVSMFTQKDSNLVTGTVVKSDGTFKIKEIDRGIYSVQVSFIGYEKVWINKIEFSSSKSKIDIGKIELTPSDQNLDEVVVESEQQMVMNSIDKKVFNVEQDITSQGGTAVDVLENVPSVTVDMDGGINLRGNSGVRILIDGRPSNLSGSNPKQALEQIPASSIESIEIITNPSAKYDPDGVTGIINIVLKKNKLSGVNGGVNLSAGTRNKYNNSLNFSIKNSKLNFSVNYSHNYYEGYRNYFQDRTAQLTDSVNRLVQEREGEDFWSNHSLNTGLDYYITPNQTIGLSFGMSHNTRERFGDMEYSLYNASDELIRRWNRIADDPGFNYGGNVNLTYEWKIPKLESGKLSADFTASTNQNFKDGFYTERFYDDQFIPEIKPSELQNNFNRGDNQFYQARIDFTTKLRENMKFETGLKTDLQSIREDFTSETYDFSQGVYLNDTNLSNDFEFNQDIFSAYAIFGHEIDKFGYQLGMRAEHAVMRSILYTTDEFYEFDYNNLFPSAHVSYKVTKTQELRLSYGRRINRPGSWSVNPFTKYTDPFNLQYGNPQIQPEYIHNFEFSYAGYFKKLTLTSAVYFRNTNNLIRRVRLVDDEGVTTTTWRNIDSETNIGLEVIGMLTLTDWWKVNLSTNLYQAYLKDDDAENDFNNQGFNWNANLVNNFKFKNGFNAQITARYRSSRILPQGIILPIYNIDAGIQKEILNKKGSLGLRVSDVFNTKTFAIDMSDRNYVAEAQYKWETRILYITFSYNFGKMENNGKRPSEGSGGGMM